MCLCGESSLSNKDPNVQECDATDDDENYRSLVYSYLHSERQVQINRQMPRDVYFTYISAVVLLYKAYYRLTTNDYRLPPKKSIIKSKTVSENRRRFLYSCYFKVRIFF